MNPALRQVVEQRLTRAADALTDARVLAGSERWNASANRLYYACFYAVTGLLLAHGHAPKKHTGARALFSQHFIRDGHVPSEFGVLYMRLFEARTDADYTDFFQVAADDVDRWLHGVAEFVRVIDQLTRTTWSES